jgi:hypothetical protein
VRENTYDPATETYSDPGATDIAYQFWTSRGTEALDITAWLKVADSVEEKLTRFDSAKPASSDVDKNGDEA